MSYKILLISFICIGCTPLKLMPCNMETRDKFSIIICVSKGGKRVNCLCQDPNNFNFRCICNYD